MRNARRTAPAVETATPADLEVQANALLASLPRERDAEYPFYLPGQGRAEGRGGRSHRFREVELPPVLADHQSDPSDVTAQWDEIDERLRSAGLTRDERLCYLLREWFGMSDRHIGRLLGVNYKTAQGRRAAAQKKLAALAGGHALSC